MSVESIQALQGLGFTELEGAIYTFLLHESPVTGYRIAQAIGKPTANTYNAISGLEAKGAILVDNGANRLCRAIPPEELLAQMTSAFRQQRQKAADALAKLETSAEDERVYQLRTREQVLERARQMLLRCRQVALVSAFPQPLEALRDALEEAAARGVQVLLKAYRPVDVAGTHMVLSSESARLLENWPGQELSLAADGEEYLHALLDWKDEAVIQAVWSQSIFLAFTHYNGLYCEWMLTTLNSKIQADMPTETLKQQLDWPQHPVNIPGYQRLLDSSRHRGGEIPEKEA